MLNVLRRLVRTLALFQGHAVGASAVELALLAPVLVIMTLNVVDVGMLVVRQMQVDNAAEMAAQAVYTECNSVSAPASTNCPGYAAAISAAVNSTTLGAAITATNAEQHCCKNSSGNFQCQVYNGATTTCTFAGDGTTAPGYYVEVSASYTYTPMFGSVSVLASTKPISSKAAMRLK